MALIALDLRPDLKLLKRFGFSAAVVFGLISVVLWRKNGLFGFDFGGALPYVLGTTLGLALLSLAFSLIKPGFNRPLYLALMVLTFPIGFVLGWVILGVLFFGMILPTGLLMRLFGKDPMARRFEPSRESYFEVRTREPEVARYFRQY